MIEGIIGMAVGAVGTYCLCAHWKTQRDFLIERVNAMADRGCSQVRISWYADQLTVAGVEER